VPKERPDDDPRKPVEPRNAEELPDRPKRLPPRIPASDTRDQETKRYTVALDHLRDAALTVTIDNGRVAKRYAPADLVAGLTDRVQTLMRDVGGGFPSMFYGALATNSMTLFFGDPRPEAAQAQLPIEVTHSHAKRIAELIDAEPDELFARAIELGEPAKRYADLVHFVESEGIALQWRPRGEEPRTLTVRHAALQYARLIAEPPHDERPLRVNGVLYRVIADRQEARLGTVGIRLHYWSAKPPSRHGVSRRVVLASYRDREVEDAIKQGLIGEPVEAVLSVRQPKLGLSIDPEHVELVVTGISRGPTEDSRLGPNIIIENDDDWLDGP
jgi:hypothetical protein